MKKIYKISILAIILLLSFSRMNAGNVDRSGQAGADELLIDPWARSSGWGGANSSCDRGLESIYLNVAGTAFIDKTELIFSRTNWLVGSGVNINNFGLSQRVSKTGVLSFAVMAMSFGEIPITTIESPDGGNGTFSPSLMNISICYAKAFSNSIYGGINLKIISESISDMSAQGVAIDAGIQYVTGKADNIKFGISLKNVGPTMKFTGDGLSLRTNLTTMGITNEFTVEQRSADFELPSLLNIGAAYDFIINKNNKITLAGNFTSNSFTNDQYILGLEYSLKTYVQLRAGYDYENGITKASTRTTAYTGPCAGFTVEVPLNKEKKSSFGIDYSYRATDPFQGTQSIGVRINL